MTSLIPVAGTNPWDVAFKTLWNVSHNDDGTEKGGGGGTDLAWFNVKDYGAVGDGTTDDSSAIQDAIDDAITAHGTVYFPYGVYLCNTGLTGGNGIRLLGSGGLSISPSAEGTTGSFGSTLLAGNTSMILLDFAAATPKQSGPKIENLNFHTGNKASVKLLRLRNYNRANMLFCAFRGTGSGSIGIEFDAALDLGAGGDCAWHNIVGCTIKDMPTLVNVIFAYGIVFLGGDWTTGSAGVGLNTIAGENIRMVGTKIDGNGAGCVGIQHCGHGSVFEGVILEGATISIASTGGGSAGDNNRFLGCAVNSIGSTVYAVTVADSGCGDNQFIGFGSEAVTLRLSDAGTNTLWIAKGDPASFPRGIISTGLPTSDPLVLGEFWSNNTVVTVSRGPGGLIPNPGFETSTTGWLASGGGASISRITTDHHSGVACCQVVVTGATTGVGTDTGAKLACQPSTSYTFGAYVKTVSGSENIELQINEYDSGGTLIGAPTVGTPFTPTGSFVQHTLPITTSGTTASLRVFVYAVGGSPASTFLVDDLSVL